MNTLLTHHHGVGLAYQRVGSIGEPLLLITGIGADMFYWHDDFCTALVDHGFQIARFDNRDSGESTRLEWADSPKYRHVRRSPDIAPYRLEDMTDDAAAVLDALGWPSAHLVGHSLGGMIGQMMAIRHPDRVRSLTSISSTPCPDIGLTNPWTTLRLLRADPAGFIGRPPRGPDDAAERLVRGHRVIGSPGYPRDEGWLRNYGRQMYVRGGHDPAAWRRQAAAVWATGDLRPALAALHVPALVVHGRADPFVRRDGGIATAAAIPDATLVVLDGMGHDLPRALWPDIIDRISTVAKNGFG